MPQGPGPGRGATIGGSMPATILFLSANPPDTVRLELDEEQRAIFEEKRRVPNAFELVAIPSARVGDLPRGLQEHRPEIVHFGGHGQRYEDHDGAAATPDALTPAARPRAQLIVRDD